MASAHLARRSCRPRSWTSTAFRAATAVAVIGSEPAFGGPDPPPPVVVDVDPLFQTGNQTKLDHSRATIDAFGCTLVTWTMFINQQCVKHGIKGADGRPISYTPNQVNTLLNDYRFTFNLQDGTTRTNNGWAQQVDPATGQIIGDPPRGAPPLSLGGLLGAIEQDTSRRSGDGRALRLQHHQETDHPTGADLHTDPVAASILARLVGGDAVPVRVDDGTGRAGHSVLITSFHQTGRDDPNGRARWDIRDPFGSSNNTERWLDAAPYTNRVFAVNAMVFQAGGVSPAYTVPSPYWFDAAEMYNPLVNPYQFALYCEIPSYDAVPSPGAWALVGIGLIVGARRRR